MKSIFGATTWAAHPLNRACAWHFFWRQA